MNRFGMLSVVALVLAGWITSYGQDREPEVPGDQFSLEGALELFKKSASPEEFERLLNSPDSKVNNLDLNGDGYIDYIRVHDRYQGNVHAFILQATLSETENQDVAVIELEKLANGKAVLQIIGDEDVFGVETIIEPTREVRTYAGTTSSRTVVNVWAWPSVQYVYGPYYAGWASPWGWYHRPVWWHTWRPVAYVYYYPIWRPYRRYYSYCDTHRIVYAHDIYRPYRTTSSAFYNRHQDQLSHYRSTRHDSDRNGHRYDEGRSYANNDRSSYTDTHEPRGRDIDRTRRADPKTDISRPENNRSTSRDRTVRPDFQKTSTERNRDFSTDRRAVTAPAERATREHVTTPVENRRRSLGTPETRTPGMTRPAAPRAEIQRSPAPTRNERSVVTERRAPSVQNNRPARAQVSAPSVNRSRSSESSHVQRSSTRTGGTSSAPARRGRN